MLINTLIILTITAVGGLYLASKVLTGKLAPWSVSLIHALLGATGLIMLIMMIVITMAIIVKILQEIQQLAIVVTYC